MSVPGGRLSPSITTYAIEAGNEQHPNDTPECDDIFDAAIITAHHHAALIAYCWCTKPPYSIHTRLGHLTRKVGKECFEFFGRDRLGKVI